MNEPTHTPEHPPRPPSTPITAVTMNCSCCNADIDPQAPVVILTRNMLDFNEGWCGCIVHLGCAPMMPWASRPELAGR